MDKLNPIEAILGCEFKLTVNVSGLDTTKYKYASLIINSNLTSMYDIDVPASGEIVFSEDEFVGYEGLNSGEHEYSVIAHEDTCGGTIENTGDKKTIIYKNTLKVYDDPTK